jgi:nucleoside-diphosphate-sugar epimerase
VRNIIIDGATSMIGATLARVALSRGCRVLCIVRPSSSRKGNVPYGEGVRVLSSDLADLSPSRWPEEYREGPYDAWYHFAWDKTSYRARDDVDSQINNIKLTIDAVRIAKELNCRSFIGAGSQAEYGPVSCDLTSRTGVDPQSGYGIAKYTAGRMSALLCSQMGIRHNWVRVLSVYGSLDLEHTLIMNSIHRLFKNEDLNLTKCEQIWDYLHEKDAARAFYAIGEHGIGGKTYVLGSGKGKPLNSYVEIIKNSINPEAHLNYGKIEYYKHQAMYLCADITELSNDTQWKPEISFENGIKEVISTVRKKLKA